MGKDKYGISIKIPDGTPKKQLEHINGMISVFKTFAKVTGEEDSIDESLKPLYEAKAKLENSSPKAQSKSNNKEDL